MNPLETLARNAKRRNMDMQCDPQWVLDLLAERDELRAKAEQLDHSGNSANMVWCACGDGYQADSYDAGFIHGSGMCQNCDATIPAKDIQPDTDDLVVWRITLPSGESCHFGTESMAKSWGRGFGKVERIDLKARSVLELVAVEQPDTVPVPRETAKSANQLRALLAGGGTV